MVTFHIPSGPKNLKGIFPGVDFDKVEEYYLVLQNASDSSTIATTNKFKRSNCCCGDSYRIFYVNYLGGIDSIEMEKVTEDTDVKSSQWKKQLSYPLNKFDGGTQRFNVTSNEIVKVENAEFTEDDQEYLKELIATPNAWVQWKGTQGQDDTYLPIVISDGKFTTRKDTERYNYVLELEFQFANENIVLR